MIDLPQVALASTDIIPIITPSTDQLLTSLVVLVLFAIRDLDFYTNTLDHLVLVLALNALCCDVGYDFAVFDNAYTCTSLPVLRDDVSSLALITLQSFIIIHVVLAIYYIVVSC